MCGNRLVCVLLPGDQVLSAYVWGAEGPRWGRPHIPPSGPPRGTPLCMPLPRVSLTMPIMMSAGRQSYPSHSVK